MASPTARSPLTLPDPQESDQDDLTRPDRSGLKNEPGLKERNMRSRYPSTSGGGASWLPFPPHVLLPRPTPAPFPDPLASPAAQPGLGSQAGMQQTGLALMVLAACVALPNSEGEWGCCLSKPPGERGGTASQDGAGRSEGLAAMWGTKFDLLRQEFPITYKRVA